MRGQSTRRGRREGGREGGREWRSSEFAGEITILGFNRSDLDLEVTSIFCVVARREFETPLLLV